MGKVVKLDASAADRRSASSRASAGRRRQRSKTALVLGGGGFTGGVYEIGALRALDLLSVNRTVNEYDVYVGTSAGAFVAAVSGQRRHARGDDARHRAAGADAVSGRADRGPAEAQLSPVHRPWRPAAPAPGAAGEDAGPRPRPDLGRRHRPRPRRGAAVRVVFGGGHRELRAAHPVGPGSDRRLPAARTTSCM